MASFPVRGSILVGCMWIAISTSAQDSSVKTFDEEKVASIIDESTLRSHIRFLADDLLEGRGPGTRGDQLTQLYLSTQMQSAGLTPAVNGSWVQPVPLIGVKTISPPTVTFHAGDQSLTLKTVEDFMTSMGRPVEQVTLKDAELVFVGYGIQAPEYQWDDYKGADLKGKVLVMMNNDPADDPTLFEGRRRLYYGRWDYKYEMAARQGAAGAIIIHTNSSAGYPWQVIQTSWSGEDSELRDSRGPRIDLKAWVTDQAMKKIVALGGHDLDQLRATAETRGFRPVNLNVSFSVSLTAEVREQDTANILGLLQGSDPKLRDEVVVFMAHHDHIGLAAERDARGDRIYNGAIDNASGSAALLSILNAINRMSVPPRRSILFAAVGAEEQGLLGSKYFAEHPTLPPGKMAAVINIDGVNIIGRTQDVNVIGSGKSNLDDLVEAVAKSQGRIVTPDHFPDRGYYYRSDQFSLAKIGVPGVYLHSGVNVIGRPEGWGKEQLDKWTDEIYHQPSDEYRDDWDLAGAIEDIRLLCRVGLRVAQQENLPEWKPGDEFETARVEAIRNANR